MLPVSLDCPFLIAPSVFSDVYLFQLQEDFGDTKEVSRSHKSKEGHYVSHLAVYLYFEEQNRGVNYISSTLNSYSDLILEIISTIQPGTMFIVNKAFYLAEKLPT